MNYYCNRCEKETWHDRGNCVDCFKNHHEKDNIDYSRAFPFDGRRPLRQKKDQGYRPGPPGGDVPGPQPDRTFPAQNWRRIWRT